MGGNMGTPPAPSQPPQVNFTTTAESRGGFNNFLRSIPQTTNMTPLPPMGSPQMPPMGGNPMANIDIFNQPMGMMGMNQPQMNPMMQPPMQQQPMNMGMMQQPMMMAGGGGVPPRRTEIMGQDHMLSYITPEEGGILKALGGSGRPGPMGIPSFFDTGEGMGSDMGTEQSSDNESNNNDSYSDNDFGGFSGYSPVDQTDFSSPDDDMDYTDEDYGYTTVDPDTGKSDMDIASNIGFNQNIANMAAQAKADAKAKADLAALNQKQINAAFVSQAKKGQADRANMISNIQDPMNPYNQMVDRSTSYSPPGSMPEGPPTSNVQAASNTNFSNVGAKGIDQDPLGLSLQGVGLGPSVNTPSIASVSPTNVPGFASVTGTGGKDVTGFSGNKDGRDVSDFSLDIDALSGKEEDAKKGTFFRNPQNPITAAINALSKIGPNVTISNIAKGYAPTYGKDGQITGTTNYGIGMGQPDNDKDMSGGNIFSSGRSVPGYDVFDATQPSVNDDTTDIGGNESDPLILRRPIAKPIEEEDDGDKPPNVIGGGDPITPPASGPVVVDSPFTSNVGDYTPVGFSAGDLNKLIAQLTGVAAPQSMAQGGVAGYAGGGLISAVDNFLASV